MNYLLPVCVTVALFGSLVYMYLVNRIYDVCREHYPALVDIEPHHYRTNLDQPFVAFSKVPPLLGAKSWQEMASASHQRLCRVAMWLQRAVIAALLGLLVPFFI
ncbi:hypothetical protein [Andreprevotia lacus]|uniref:hypothetical protein n=1 Tax=Andreprevotia lacus TaxID=1121000 RepID=UPI00111BF270|nr:hypothetical protein [Andreprevotia lacus]